MLTTKVKSDCFNECPFGFKAYDNYCVSNDLADLS